MRWAGHPDRAAELVRLEALSALYHPLSGETHLLVDEAVAILRQLERGSCDEHELRVELAIDEAAVATHLLDLFDAGLIVAA